VYLYNNWVTFRLHLLSYPVEFDFCNTVTSITGTGLDSSLTLPTN
jgi:hypothetical protein